MGCTQSKIENEEAVSRCRERKQFMKDAVTARNTFAAAHSAYIMALKNTGAALSDYGPGEVEVEKAIPTKTTTIETLPPPPPPLPDFSPAPLQRAVSMPDMPMSKLVDPKPTHATTIQEEEDDDDDDDDDDEVELEHRNGGSYNRDKGSSAVSPPRPPPPIPSAVSQPRPAPPIPTAAATTATTSRSVPLPPESQPTDTWDFFFETGHVYGGTALNEPPEEEEGEETKPAINESDDDHHRWSSKQENHHGFKGEEEEEDSGVVSDPVTPEKVFEPTMETTKTGKKQKQLSGGGGSSSSSSIQHVVSSSEQQSKRVGNKGRNLLQILGDLDDYFLKASESAHDVSNLLEANRLHYHSNFADNRGHIDHSARVMRVITWNKSFRGMPNAEDGKDGFETEESESLATVLDKLLAWEKKLYDEVKEGERMKIDYQRKVALLNKQKKRGASAEAIEKAKAAVSHLHTRYIVDMQSMDSTVTEIHHLRDNQLFPRLLKLVEGMGKMWEAMFENHACQLKVVADIRGLDISNAPKETSEQHHGRTVQLFNVASEWHRQFEKLATHQKEYIQALNSWLRVNLVPIESNLKEKVSSPPRATQPPIKALLQVWHDHLEKLPDELAKNAISSFAAVINSIVLHQEEELKQKEKCEELKKDYARKSKAFDDWQQKYLQRRAAAEAADPERAVEGKEDQVLLDRQVAVEALKKKYEEEVEGHQKLCKQVREKSLASLKTHLPELFRAMSDFAHFGFETYKKLLAISPPLPSHHEQNSV